jgi:hypothetical protein
MGLDETMGETLANVLSLPRRRGASDPVWRLGSVANRSCQHQLIDIVHADLILRFLLVLGARTRLQGA